MKGITDLLERYKNFTPPDMVVRKRLAGILSDEVRRTVREKDIKIIGPVAYCTLDGLLKNIVFLKKEKILSRVKEEFGKQVVRDIQ
jgi:hypothetical protein